MASKCRTTSSASSVSDFILHLLLLTTSKLSQKWMDNLLTSGAQMEVELLKSKKSLTHSFKEELKLSSILSKIKKISSIRHNCKKLPKNIQTS